MDVESGLLDWQDLVSQPPGNADILHLCQDGPRKLDLGTRFLEEGLRRGERAIVFGSPHDLEGVGERLASHGLDVPTLESEGPLIAIDMADLRANILRSGSLDRDAAWGWVRATMEQSEGTYGGIRCWGNLAGALFDEGNFAAVEAWENVGRDITRDLPWKVLCSYPLGTVEPERDAEALWGVLGRHTHLIPDGGLAKAFTLMTPKDGA